MNSSFDEDDVNYARGKKMKYVLIQRSDLGPRRDQDKKTSLPGRGDGITDDGNESVITTSELLLRQGPSHYFLYG